jgi:hypothetical protein
MHAYIHTHDTHVLEIVTITVTKLTNIIHTHTITFTKIADFTTYLLIFPQLVLHFCLLLAHDEVTIQEETFLIRAGACCTLIMSI